MPRFCSYKPLYRPNARGPGRLRWNWRGSLPHRWRMSVHAASVPVSVLGVATVKRTSAGASKCTKSTASTTAVVVAIAFIFVTVLVQAVRLQELDVSHESDGLTD